MKKWSNLLWIRPETWFWWKVKHFDLGFLILHISHKSKVFFISISFVKDFFFKIGFLPWISSIEVLKNKLKLPPSITFLFTILGILFSISDSLVRVTNCSFSVFALYRLASRGSLSQIFISTVKILPWSSFLVSTTSKDFEPRKEIATPQGLLYHESKIFSF